MNIKIGELIEFLTDSPLLKKGDLGVVCNITHSINKSAPSTSEYTVNVPTKLCNVEIFLKEQDVLWQVYPRPGHKVVFLQNTVIHFIGDEAEVIQSPDPNGYLIAESGGGVKTRLEAKERNIVWKLIDAASPSLLPGKINTPYVPNPNDFRGIPEVKEMKKSEEFVGSHNLPYNPDWDDPFDYIKRTT